MRIVIILVLFSSLCSCNKKTKQLYNDRFFLLTSQHEDLLSALEFSGVAPFKFTINNIPKDRQLLLYIKEFTKNENENKIIDTFLIAETNYYKFITDTTWVKESIKTIRINTQREFEDGDYFYIQGEISGVTGPKKRIAINDTYRVLHSWRPFVIENLELGVEKPLLLYGSWWEDTLNGVKVKRFCTSEELNFNLNEYPFNLIPHYYLIYIKIE